MKYALITGLFISSIFAGVNTTQIKVDGMQCSSSCAGKVNSVVQKIEGVKESSVDFAKGIATVTYDDKKVNRNDIIKNLKSNTGYLEELNKLSN
jgi:copper chaperone CopZ